LAFSLHNVSIIRNKQVVLQDFNLVIKPGKLYYITGLNGSGKTSLLKVLCKMLPYSGSILFNQRELFTWPDKKFNRTVAVVHQLQTQVFSFSVKEFILMGRFDRLKFLGNYADADYAALEKYSAKTGVLKFLNRSLGTLSGGELQRVYLAQALIRETPVLMLDEPSRFLDPKSRMELYHMLNTLAEEGLTILCVSHDMETLSDTKAHFIGLAQATKVWDAPLRPEDWAEFRKQVYSIDPVANPTFLFSSENNQ